MTLASLAARLRRVEARRGVELTGDVARMSDAHLEAAIRQSYADLRAEYGSLAQAVANLRATGDDGDAALALLIEEDIGHDAPSH